MGEWSPAGGFTALRRKTGAHVHSDAICMSCCIGTRSTLVTYVDAVYITRISDSVKESLQAMHEQYVSKMPALGLHLSTTSWQNA